MLESVNDRENLGGLFRTAVVLGVDVVPVGEAGVGVDSLTVAAIAFTRRAASNVAAFKVIDVDRGRTGMQPGEPTPWATGLTVSAVAAAIVGIALISLSQGLAPNGTGFVVVANLLVAAGLAPSIWLGRSTPTWRWVAYGTATGIVLTWIALLLSLLG